MKYSEAKLGRVFILRLEDGDILHDCVERFAREKQIKAASLIGLGGADKNSVLIVGPRQGRARVIEPNEIILNHVHEVTGVGTLFPNKEGNPVLHMHLACGRKSETYTGCVRRGIKVWHVMEIIIFELINCTAMRKKDTSTGFELMNPS
ncbi:DNA-binding protein [bacterium]|nr:DNA-binding protein [bacterium]